MLLSDKTCLPGRDLRPLRFKIKDLRLDYNYLTINKLIFDAFSGNHTISKKKQKARCLLYKAS